MNSALGLIPLFLRDIQAIAAQADQMAPASILQRLVPTYQGERGVNAYAAVDRALAAVEKNAGVKIVADWLVLQL